MALTKVTMTGASKEKIKAGFEKVNDIIDDLAAATSGLGASCIGVYDSAGNMAATNVEAALAEVYTDVADSRTMAQIFSAKAATTTGLTWGYYGGNIRTDNTITTVADGTVALTDDATNYIEVDSAGTFYANTSAFTAGRIPIRQVVCASGVQTTSTDKRGWFPIIAQVSDTAFAAAWNDDTTNAPSKNAVYNKIVGLMPGLAYKLTDGATIAIDWDNGATQYVTLGATGRTVTFANPVSGQIYRLIIIQDGTGSRTITTWPSIKWSGGAAPALTTGANDIDIVTLLYTNSVYYGDCSFDFAAPA